MRVRTLLTEQRLPRPVETVFDFFSNANNLDTLTPPWLHFRILTAPQRMCCGAILEYRLPRCRAWPSRNISRRRHNGHPARFDKAMGKFGSGGDVRSNLHGGLASCPQPALPDAHT